jgi:endoglycosylceramidase
MRPRRVLVCPGALAAVGALVLAAAVCVSSAGASPAFPLNHARRWITDADGRVVIVHGTNMVYKRPPYYPSAAGFGEEDAEFLQSIGFDAVRLGVM